MQNQLSRLTEWELSYTLKYYPKDMKMPYRLLLRQIDKIMTDETEFKDLVVSKILHKDLYNTGIYSLRMSEAGITLTRGDTIQYIYSDATHEHGDTSRFHSRTEV